MQLWCGIWFIFIVWHLTTNAMKQFLWCLHHVFCLNKRSWKLITNWLYLLKFHQSGKAYLQEFWGVWCIFIVWHSTVMWQGSIFGCFSQGSIIIKLLNMAKHVVFDPNSFLHQLRKAYLQQFCGGWYIFIIWHSTAMWLGSSFGCFSQCSIIIKAVKHG